MEFQESGVYIPPDQVNIRLTRLYNYNICCLTFDWWGGGPVLGNDGGNISFGNRNGEMSGNLELDSPVTETRPTNRAVRYLVRALD